MASVLAIHAGLEKEQRLWFEAMLYANMLWNNMARYDAHVKRWRVAELEFS